MTQRAVRVVVRGRVQGVGFRMGCRRKALALGIGGWVRNRPDGTVEAVYAGSAESVAAMLAWTREPALPGFVSGVDVEDVDDDGRQGFEIR